MVYSVTFLAQLNGDTTYQGSGGGTGTAAGALRWREGHDPAVMAAIIEEGTVNYFPKPFVDSGSGGNTFAAWNGATQSQESTQPSPWTPLHLKIVTPGVTTFEGVAEAGSSYRTISNIVGPYTASVRVRGAGEVQASVVERESTGSNWTEYFGDPVTASAGAWQLVSATGTFSDPLTDRVGMRLGTTTPQAVTFYADGFQIEEKDHPTSLCPELEADDITPKPGYVWNATPHWSTSTREAASIRYPIAAPDWIAVRVSADDGATWSVAYLTSADLAAGPNVATYGSITHDGTDLVIASDRRTVFGPILAGAGSLTTENKSVLESTTVWSLGMSLDAPPENAAPVVDAGASTDTANTGQGWTRSGSFTDSDGVSTSWTATVNYGDGAGPVPLTLAGKTFSLSHTYTTTGTYTVTVVVTDDDSLTGSDSVTVTVTDAPTTGAYLVATGVVGTDASAPVVTLD